MGDDEDVTIGELARSIKRLDTKFDRFMAEAVLRSEFEARLTAHDREIRDIKSTHERDIADLKAAHERDIADVKGQFQVHVQSQQQVAQHRQVPWTAVAAVVIAASVLLADLIPKLAGG